MRQLSIAMYTVALTISLIHLLITPLPAYMSVVVFLALLAGAYSEHLDSKQKKQHPLSNIFVKMFEELKKDQPEEHRQAVELNEQLLAEKKAIEHKLVETKAELIYANGEIDYLKSELAKKEQRNRGLATTP